MNFKKILEASNEYKGGNPNSLSAWIHTDISMTKDNRIFISDEFGNFEWDQSKSNDNVKGISKIGSGEGKGFSFYFARYAYSDKYICSAEQFVTGTGQKSSFLARIRFDWLDKYFRDPSIKERLSPDNSVLLLINEGTNPKEIVSATYKRSAEEVDFYSSYMSSILVKEDIKSYAPKDRLNEFIKEQEKDIINIQAKEKTKLLITKSIIEGIKEFEKMINED